MTIEYSKVISKSDGTRGKLWAYALARRVVAVQQAMPNLPPARLLNRLHALGIDCNQRDLDEALMLSDLNGKDAGLSVKDAALIVGVEIEVLEGWIANPQQSDANHDAMPRLGEVYRSTAGRVTTYDYFDVLILSRWKKAQTPI